MASTRFIGINASQWEAGADTRFLSEMSNTIHTGNGAISMFSSRMNLDDATPLRLLVGIPKADLLPQQKKFTEAFHAYLFNVRKDDMPSIWTGKPNWQPLNHERRAAPINESRLDYDFLMSLGLRQATWEKRVLFTDLDRTKRNQSTEPETIRLYLAFSMFGFPSPEQFFTLR